MPVYEYRCTKCQHLFERYQAVGESPPECPKCGSPTRKVYGSVGLIFKGSGFHTTDYRKSAPSNGDKSAEKTAAEKTSTEKTSTEKTSTEKPSSRGSTPAASDTPSKS